MMKPFNAKVSALRSTADDVRTTVRTVGDAAHSQVTLNIALTACCVTALLVAALLVHDTRRTAEW